MPALRLAEDIAGAPDLQIAQGDFKARTERRMFFDGFEAVGGLFGQTPALRVEEVGPCLSGLAPDSAAQLIHL